MPYILKSPQQDSFIGLPCQVTGQLNTASENDLKVIIYVYSRFPNGFEADDTAQIASELCLDSNEVSASIAFWRGAGIIKTAKSLKKTAKASNCAEKSADSAVKIPVASASKPVYPSEQVAKAIQDNPSIKTMVNHCQKSFGKTFGPSQLSTLYSFYENLGFDPECIMLVTEHCVIIEKTSLGYMEKILITLSDNGITSYRDIEKYLSDKLKYSQQEKKLRRLCGFTSRELSPSEKKIIGVWFKEWELDFSLVERAYEITIDRISKPSLKYMNSILNSWHQQGISDPDRLDSDKPDSTIEKSHDADEFFRAAVAKSMSSINT